MDTPPNASDPLVDQIADIYGDLDTEVDTRWSEFGFPSAQQQLDTASGRIKEIDNPYVVHELQRELRAARRTVRTRGRIQCVPRRTGSRSRERGPVPVRRRGSRRSTARAGPDDDPPDESDSSSLSPTPPVGPLPPAGMVAP